MEETRAGVPVRFYENTPSGVDCFVTTRGGGFSEGCYSSMNMGFFTDDDRIRVFKNTELLKSAYGLNRLAVLSQVHGNIVREVTDENYAEVLFSEGDGLFTMQKGLAVAVQTADCFNVFLAGKKGIAALHCGRESVYKDIMGECVKLFEKHGDFPVFAGIGPGISAENYEVNRELADKFAKICTEAVQADGGRYRLCLRTAIERNLRARGIENIEHMSACTFDDPDLYSHRRDKGLTGRMAGVIVRREIV